MMSFEESREMILRSVTTLEAEQTKLLESLGLIIAETVIAPVNLPPFDNSAMDGYAVRVGDCGGSEPLTITGYIPAGGVATAEVTPGTAVKIMTGAPIPRGCDAIVPIEEAEQFGDTVRIVADRILPGQHIRRAGEDVRQGETVLVPGTVIRVPEIGLLATLGRADVYVYRRPLVAILSTGDELVEPGQPLPKGKVFNCNSQALAAAVREAGAVPILLGIAQDDRVDTSKKIAEGLQADVLITAAGVSVGDRDFVRETLAALAVKQILWKVDMKPGKVMAFGTHLGKLVFSLPGNPVSAMITFEELVRPALLKLMGHKQVLKPLVTAVLQEGLRKKPGKTYFLRVKLKSKNDKYLAWSAGKQDTGCLKTMVHTDALAILPADRTWFAAGEEISVHMLGSCVVEECDNPTHSQNVPCNGAFERATA